MMKKLITIRLYKNLNILRRHCLLQEKASKENVKHENNSNYDSVQVERLTLPGKTKRNGTIKILKK